MSLGQIHDSAGRAQEALDSFHRALEVQPNNPWAHHFLAKFLLQSSDPEFRDPAQAVEHATKAVQEMPNNADFLAILGRAYYKTRDDAAAVDPLEKSLAGANSINASADRFHLAIAQSRLGHEQEALRWYHEAVDLIQNNNNAWVSRLQAEAAEVLGIAKEVEADEQP